MRSKFFSDLLYSTVKKKGWNRKLRLSVILRDWKCAKFANIRKDSRLLLKGGLENFQITGFICTIHFRDHVDYHRSFYYHTNIINVCIHTTLRWSLNYRRNKRGNNKY